MMLWAMLSGIPVAQAQPIVITLKRSFIEEFKDRATIDATFTIDTAHENVNPPSKDGDMHVAGRAPEIGLATVAELMNAKGQTAAVNLVHNVEGTGNSVAVTGAWRIWCEHAGGKPQVQGTNLAPFTTTNPDHVFEIHPVTRLKNLDLRSSLIKITGFKTKDAEQSFLKYEDLDCQLSFTATTATIKTQMAGYNYVEFRMVLLEEPETVSDGTMAFASVHTLDGDMLVHRRRMVFLKGSPPEKALLKMKVGDTLHVLGIPRLNLKLISWRIEHFNDDPEIAEWRLPYEIIIAGAYKK